MQLCLASHGLPLASKLGEGLTGLGLAFMGSGEGPLCYVHMHVHLCMCKPFLPLYAEAGGGGKGVEGCGDLSHPPLCPHLSLQRLPICSHPEFAGDQRACTGMVGAWLVLGGCSAQEASSPTRSDR